jgi:hypothetical protein
MKIPRWAQVLIGVGIVMVFLGIGALVAITAYFSEHMVVSESSAREADDEFEKVRQQFKGQQPLVELKDGVSRAVRDPTASPGSSQGLKTLHVLAWDSHEEKLVNVAVPWWVVRMKSGPIRFSSYASGLDDSGVSLRPEDIERHGPGIILDGTGPRGERVLLWAN